MAMFEDSTDDEFSLENFGEEALGLEEISTVKAEESSSERTEEQLDDLSFLESLEEKIDVLTQMSDESLGELNDLLDSEQEDNHLEEENQRLHEIYKED
jgi:hypothetical protein